MAMAAAAAEAFGTAAPPTPPVQATRQDVQAAIAKAVELRALHAALLQRGGGGASAGRSPAIIRLPPAASPALSRTTAAATTDEDYPVFTPVYDEEQMSGLSHICQDNRSRSENWSGIALDHRAGGNGSGVASAGDDDDDAAAFSDYDNLNAFYSSTSDVRFPSSTDHHHRRHKVHPAFLHSATPSAADRFLASAGRAVAAPPPPAFRPATIGRDHGIADAGALKFLTSIRTPAAQPRPKHRGAQILSWLFPRSTKKKAAARPPEMMTSSSPTAIERENMSQLLKEWGLLSLDSLRRELADANACRDAALQDAAEMRSSLGELTTKLAGLEAYCSELKKALRQATASSSSNAMSRRSARSSIGASRELSMPVPGPVSHEAMVEGFLQIASEARLSVKQFCKGLIHHVEEEPDNGLAEKLNLLLQPYNLMISDSDKRHCSKLVLYHLEALMNQAMYQDFENCTFQKNGSPRWLDPKQEAEESFASFVALRNLSWNEVLRKGTKYYSEDFSRFCDQKMSCIVSTLKNWSRPWPEQLLQCFFVAAKCVWLLHLLAFSFSPALTIMRVEESRAFDQMYMEDIIPDKQQMNNPCQVKIMVMPGFYVQDRVLKCRVLTTL
uniref:GIL1/IRKI C-terminal domain-containing protein n=1 Tax=Leersia perrieri TaxID=77586 RepID=A0A0D9XF35_9ORYZ